MSDTATVEVLTAEVRVLMVGSRQVTLSIAKQLDRVSLRRMEPFGRVRIGDVDNLVIGRSREDGSLVTAPIVYLREQPIINVEDLDPSVEARPVVCNKQMTDRDGYFRLSLDGRSIALEAKAATRCGQHGYMGDESCGSWNHMGHASSFQAAIDELDATRAMYARARVLPLIVLAGLR
jgi:hypothetical protein